MISSTVPVVAICYLVGTFGWVALSLLDSGLGFLGLSYVIVYVGAISVLFVFVVMLLDVRALEAPASPGAIQSRLPFVFIVALFVAFCQVPLGAGPIDLISAFSWSPDVASSLDTFVLPSGQCDAIASLLYYDFGICLLLVGLLLLLAIVGPIALCLA